MQGRSLVVYAIAALALVAVGVGVVIGWIMFTGGTGEASEPITAPTLDPAAEPSIFRITQEESEARFYIDETLRGERVTVVGTTDQVAGEIAVNFDNPPASQVGTIRVNVRTLQTDESLRNQAIRGQILQSARPEYEFSEFVPSALEGLPESVAIGETVGFQIIGDLTLRDVTRTLTFDAEVTVTAEDRLEGVARTTILFEDFNVNIPRLPSFVADVDDEVVLEIQFVALAVNEEA
jgi:polyisoprenoid-binding protein YceI